MLASSIVPTTGILSIIMSIGITMYAPDITKVMDIFMKVMIVMLFVNEIPCSGQRLIKAWVSPLGALSCWVMPLWAVVFVGIIRYREFSVKSLVRALFVEVSQVVVHAVLGLTTVLYSCRQTSSCLRLHQRRPTYTLSSNSPCLSLRCVP